MDEKINLTDVFGATITMNCQVEDKIVLKGIYTFECFGPDGKLKWQDIAENTVVESGKDLALDTFLSGTAYTVTGPFMGLISFVSFTEISSFDTMLSHAGWLEAGNANAPTYTAPRKTAVWNPAVGGTKALSASLSFVITSLGAIKGAFMTYGTGAVNTIDNTGGTLFSAGLFASGDRGVQPGDVVNVSYSVSA